MIIADFRFYTVSTL